MLGLSMWPVLKGTFGNWRSELITLVMDGMPSRVSTTPCASTNRLIKTSITPHTAPRMHRPVTVHRQPPILDLKSRTLRLRWHDRQCRMEWARKWLDASDADWGQQRWELSTTLRLAYLKPRSNDQRVDIDIYFTDGKNCLNRVFLRRAGDNNSPHKMYFEPSASDMLDSSKLRGAASPELLPPLDVFQDDLNLLNIF
jgi:hypothetical protein